MPQRFTWNKAEKLKSRKRIDQVFKQGKNFSVFPFKVFYLVSAPGQTAAAPKTEDVAAPRTATPGIATTGDGPAASVPAPKTASATRICGRKPPFQKGRGP